MTSALIRKLSAFAKLNEAQQAMLSATCGDVRVLPAKTDLMREGDRPEFLHLIMEGWAARYKTLPDGSQQIVGFPLPGDFLNAPVTIVGHMDHSVRTVTRCTMTTVKDDRLQALLSEDRLLEQAFRWSTLVEEATLRSWIVNLGRRDAYERIAHLFCEIHDRLGLVGLVQSGRFDFPLTQTEIADAVGLTAVHTNRTLQRLRADKLIETSHKCLTVLDLVALQKAAGFDPNFLQIDRRVLQGR